MDNVEVGQKVRVVYPNGMERKGVVESLDSQDKMAYVQYPEYGISDYVKFGWITGTWGALR